jgi:hypothetical protein
MSTSVRIAAKNATNLAGFALKLAPWGASLGLIGGWLVYPTLTSEFKENFGMGEAPPLGVAPAGSSVKYAKEGIGQTPEVAS